MEELTVEQFAGMVRYKEGTIRQWISQGKVPVKRDPQRRRSVRIICDESVRRIIEERKPPEAVAVS